MASFQRVLFPVDFSEQTTRIAPYVVCMARRYKAHVSMLHVMETRTGPYPGCPEYGIDIDIPAMREDHEQRLGSFLKHEFEDVSTSRILLEGDPAWRIVEYAGREKIDLIMMPTHGYGPFRRLLLGSVTAKLLHDVKCPVWTCAHTDEAPAPPAGYRNVLCGMDLSANSLPVLRWASEFAREQGASLTLAHAVPAAKVPGALESEGGRFREFLFDWAREEMAKLQKEAGTDLKVMVEGGDVSQVIADAARAARADLIVIGRGVMHHVLGRMRTHVYSIIREAPSPVISI